MQEVESRLQINDVELYIEYNWADGKGDDQNSQSVMVCVIECYHPLGSRCDILGFESEFTCSVQGTDVKACAIINQRQGDTEFFMLHRDVEGLVVAYPRKGNTSLEKVMT